MLRQYGISNPSSLTPVIHPEDAQPNEQTRKQKRPPLVSSSSTPIRGLQGFQRGGYRGMYQGNGPFTQYATRGSSARRGRGHDQGPSRGSFRPPIVNQGQQDRCSIQTPNAHGVSGHTSQTYPPAPISRYARASWVQPSGSQPQTEFVDTKPPVPVIHNSIMKPRVPGHEYEPSRTGIKNRSPSPPRSSLPTHPNLPRKPQTHWSQQQNTSATASSNKVHFALSEPDFGAPYRQVSVDRTIPSPKHEIREPTTPAISTSQPKILPAWLMRSRSPSPKLPASPLKRRKLDHNYTVLPTRSEDNKSDQVNETIYAQTPPPNIVRNNIPLPGRVPSLPRKPSEVIHVKEERLSPVKIVAEAGPSVKQEYSSPSPPLPSPPQRKLIKESINFYPLPNLCKKSTPEFTRNRRTFFMDKKTELRKLGLTTTKAFWRDDGLVIEWSSSVPVWSDTIKPDIPDLAVAIQRAHELNEMKSAHSTPKRKRAESTASRISNSPGVVEVKPKGIVTPKGPREKKKLRHWADGISLEELERATNLSSPSLAKRPQETTIKRAPLPTRLPATKPASITSNVAKPSYDPPDPVIVPPSQEWKVLAKRNDASTSASGPARMIFKPTNPRKSQGAAQEALATTVTEDAVPERQELESIQPISGGSSQVVGLGPHGAVSAITALSQLSPTTTKATPKIVPTPESTRSPTLVNEYMSTDIPPNQSLSSSANENLEDLSGCIPATANEVQSKMTDVDDEGDSEAVAMDLLYGTSSRADVTSSDSEGDSMDDETENTVQQFISKYASMFDFDRRTLKKAYSKDALFSCRVHHAQPNSCASLFVPESKDAFRSTHSRASASQVIQGRTQICDKLLELGQYQFIPRGVPVNPTYTWSMSKLDGVPNGILLSLYGEVVKTEADPDMDHRLAVNQTFLLRQRAPEDDTDDDDGTDIPGQTNLKNFWPLAVVSHQMTVRSNPLLNTKDLHIFLPWIDDILH